MFSVITTDFRKTFREIFYPKYENKMYCKYLQQAYIECSKNNPENYKPCHEIYEFIKVINCFDPTPKIIQSNIIRSNINNKI